MKKNSHPEEESNPVLIHHSPTAHYDDDEHRDALPEHCGTGLTI
jgi:hypothetical protein